MHKCVPYKHRHASFSFDFFMKHDEICMTKTSHALRPKDTWTCILLTASKITSEGYMSKFFLCLA